jgi:hypothetical protein
MHTSDRDLFSGPGFVDGLFSYLRSRQALSLVRGHPPYTPPNAGMPHTLSRSAAILASTYCPEMNQSIAYTL